MSLFLFQTLQILHTGPLRLSRLAFDSTAAFSGNQWLQRSTGEECVHQCVCRPHQCVRLTALLRGQSHDQRRVDLAGQTCCRRQLVHVHGHLESHSGSFNPRRRCETIRRWHLSPVTPVFCVSPSCPSLGGCGPWSPPPSWPGRECDRRAPAPGGNDMVFICLLGPQHQRHCVNPAFQVAMQIIDWLLHRGVHWPIQMIIDELQNQQKCFLTTWIFTINP